MDKETLQTTAVDKDDLKWGSSILFLVCKAQYSITGSENAYVITICITKEYFLEIFCVLHWTNRESLKFSTSV